MSTSAIALMSVAMILVWGGLVWFAWNLRYRKVPVLPAHTEELIARLEAEEAAIR